MVRHPFRASARFELKRLDELTLEQRRPFAELERDDDFHGLLVPRSPFVANVKSVGREGAALFQRLASPEMLDADDEIIDLVLDGILEVEHDGDFRWGAAALPLLTPFAASAPVDGLSIEALRHAGDLATDDAGALTTALYLYNRIPLSRFWESRFPDRDAVLGHLGADRGALAALLASLWTSSPSQGWIAWHARERRPRDPNAPTFKLYVSVRPESIRDAFETVVRVFAEAGGVDFKIGENAWGLLRPDKLVAYFATRAELDDVAAALQPRLAACAAHGVPFSTPIDAAGILSWGVDPPDSDRALSWLGRESWRLWLAKRLGAAIAFAKASPAGDVPPWRFALERVRRIGVDVERWTPTDALWSAA
jgi:hypothetical protein